MLWKVWVVKLERSATPLFRFITPRSSSLAPHSSLLIPLSISCLIAIIFLGRALGRMGPPQTSPTRSSNNGPSPINVTYALGHCVPRNPTVTGTTEVDNLRTIWRRRWGRDLEEGREETEEGSNGFCQSDFRRSCVKGGSDTLLKKVV
ncbi:unnamed protein product [Nezara viridula]|uniref:Uncharacterized protein n=1 Tax=Nezara viridula TaxID=85310 RepID=A0A9P0E565_NEZVI|nr:unnamed protein product [Nezara viridula]